MLLAKPGTQGGDVLTRRRSVSKLRSCGRRVACRAALGMMRNRLAGSEQDPVTAEMRA